jgi:hypothetical protein
MPAPDAVDHHFAGPAPRRSGGEEFGVDQDGVVPGALDAVEDEGELVALGRVEQAHHRDAVHQAGAAFMAGDE